MFWGTDRGYNVHVFHPLCLNDTLQSAWNKMYLHILPEMICYPESDQLPYLVSLSPISECKSVCRDCRRQTVTGCHVIMPVRTLNNNYYPLDLAQKSMDNCLPR